MKRERGKVWVDLQWSTEVKRSPNLKILKVSRFPNRLFIYYYISSWEEEEEEEEPKKTVTGTTQRAIFKVKDQIFKP